MNSNRKILSVLNEGVWLSTKEILLKTPEIKTKIIGSIIHYLRKKQFVKARALKGKNDGLIHNSYQYLITKKGINYLNRKNMRQIKILILKVFRKSVIPYSWHVGIKNGISGINCELYEQFNKNYSYHYIQKMVRELVKEKLLFKYNFYFNGYAHYDITKKGYNFLENLEEEEQ